MAVEQPRVALVYAPFGACSRPALGISLLKSVLAQEGIPCDIYYANLILARELGAQLCDSIALDVPTTLFGEWMFAPALFGENGEADRAYVQQVLWGEYRDSFTPAVVRELLRLRDHLPAFLDACSAQIDWSRYDWIGFSTAGQQNCASLALARRIKARFPDARTIFGGGNCSGAMGAALCRLFPFVDYVCTGYGETAFPRLVRTVADGDGTPAVPGIVARDGNAHAGPVRPPAEVADLDSLPYPDYSDYFAQLQTVDTPPEFDVRILMEASRGCWWGEKSQCAFCGLHATARTYRCKSPDRVLAEVRYLVETYCAPYGNKVFFTDTVLGQHYFPTVIAGLARQPGIWSGWEVRANLTREQVSLLAEAGVRTMQIGVESLSDAILHLIHKGTTVTDNLQALKWSKQFGIPASWNFVWGFPGEDPAEYRAMEAVVPYLTHLAPPSGFGHVRFERYSAYWTSPASYGISHLEAARPYRYIYHALPADDVNELAYMFDADYPDDSATYTQGLRRALRAWQDRPDARLDLFPSPNSIRIVDTREPGAAREYRFDGLAAELYLLCDAAQSVRALMEAPAVGERAGEAEIVTLLDGFVEQGLMICSGKKYLSLAVLREPAR